MEYIVIHGPNTKQWWVYNEEEDFYIDPPSEVLNQVEAFSSDINEQEEYFQNIVDENPSWLYDEDYYYEDVEL